MENECMFVKIANLDWSNKSENQLIATGINYEFLIVDNGHCAELGWRERTLLDGRIATYIFVAEHFKTVDQAKVYAQNMQENQYRKFFEVIAPAPNFRQGDTFLNVMAISNSLASKEEIESWADKIVDNPLVHHANWLRHETELDLLNCDGEPCGGSALSNKDIYDMIENGEYVAVLPSETPKQAYYRWQKSIVCDQ